MSSELASPLIEIEQRVQDRAKDEALDLDDAGARLQPNAPTRTPPKRAALARGLTGAVWRRRVDT